MSKNTKAANAIIDGIVCLAYFWIITHPDDMREMRRKVKVSVDDTIGRIRSCVAIFRTQSEIRDLPETDIGTPDH